MGIIVAEKLIFRHGIAHLFVHDAEQHGLKTLAGVFQAFLQLRPRLILRRRGINGRRSRGGNTPRRHVFTGRRLFCHLSFLPQFPQHILKARFLRPGLCRVVSGISRSRRPGCHAYEIHPIHSIHHLLTRSFFSLAVLPRRQCCQNSP